MKLIRAQKGFYEGGETFHSLCSDKKVAYQYGRSGLAPLYICFRTDSLAQNEQGIKINSLIIFSFVLILSERSS